MIHQVLIFGPYAEAVGEGRVDVTLLDDQTVTARVVMESLREQQPALRLLLAHAILAVNCRRVGDETLVNAGDELAIVGLVSGG